MADVKWIKIVTDVFDDEKILLIESLPEADAIIVIWFKLLCLAGKQNNQGVFLLNNKIPYTDEMFATIFRRNVATVRLALSTFEKFGMIEIIDGVITIPNWSKHQSLDALEKKREYQRALMQKRRAEQKALCDANSEANSDTNGDTNGDANVSSLDKNREDKNREDKNINKRASVNADFEYLWSLYPKKRGKQAALKAYEAAVKRGTTKEEVEKGIKAYIASINANRTESRYIKHGDTFFRGAHWQDEYDITGVNNNDGIYNQYGGISNSGTDWRSIDEPNII